MVDDNRTPRESGSLYVSRVEPEAKPPPALESGLLKWMRENLFSSVGNGILTLIGLFIVVYTTVNITTWVVQTGNWLSITANLRQYMVGSFPPELMWRLQVLMLYSILVIGMAVAMWIKQIARTMFVSVVVIVLMLLLLPPMTKSMVDLPSFYMLAGDGVIETGSVTETAIPEVAFIGRADEEINIRLADDEVASEEALATYNGYASIPANTLRNAATNRLALIAEREDIEAQLQAHETALAEDGIPILTQAQVESFTNAAAAFEIPEPIIETYSINSIAVRVSIVDAQTGEALGEPIVLESADDVASFVLPADGWYILQKVDANAIAPDPDSAPETDTEEAAPAQNSQDIRNVSTVASTSQDNGADAELTSGGTLALLQIHGIYPARLGNTTNNEGFTSAYVRATDFFALSVAANPVPRDDSNTDLPYVVITSNQYRGERGVGDWLRAYVTPFFDKAKVPTSIFLIFGIVGYFAADLVKSRWKTPGDNWHWTDSAQVWLIILVMLSVLLGADAIPIVSNFADGLQGLIFRILICLVLAIYPVSLLFQKANATTANSLTTMGFMLLPIVMWIFVNGFFITTAFALCGVLALVLLCLAIYRLTKRDKLRFSGDELNNSLLVITAIVLSYGALWLLMQRLDSGSWAIWILQLGFIPLIISAFIGSAGSLPESKDEISPNSIIGLFVVAGIIIVVLYISGVGLQDPRTTWIFSVSNPDNWSGLLLTMMLTVYGIIVAFPIGLGLALGRRSDLPLIKYLCTAYIELIRGSPFITVLFFMKLLIPLIRPELASVPNGYRAIIATIAFSAAYLAENVRGGLQSLPPGQNEAAKALGLNAWQTTVLITMPQALRAVIPALVGQFISLFKDTSLVTIIGLIDLTGVVNSMAVQPEFVGTRLEGLLFISGIYFVFSYVLSYVSRLLEASGSGATRRMT